MRARVPGLEAAPAGAVPARPARPDEDEALLRPVLRTTWRFWVMGAVLAAVSLWGVNAYLVQFEWGKVGRCAEPRRSEGAHPLEWLDLHNSYGCSSKACVMASITLSMLFTTSLFQKRSTL